MKIAICILLMGASCVVGVFWLSADSPPAPTGPAIVSPDDSLQEIARATTLTITDLSVPFERFGEAPDKLRQLANVIANGPYGIYVLRYSDDTLRHTQHVFVIQPESKTYIRLTTILNEPATRRESTINSAEYDELAKTLTLHTAAEEIYLAPADITPVGA